MLSINERFHAPLSGHERQMLRRLADPAAELPAFRDPGVDSLVRILAGAHRHSILPIVWRRLNESGLGRTETTSVPTAQQDPLEEAGRQVILLVGQSMLLAHHGTMVLDAFRSAGIDATIIKGPVCARRLYTITSDRSFTDIDILVAPHQVHQANAIIADLGFNGPDFDGPNAEDYSEFQWILSEDDVVMIEVHTNLVHSLGLRRALSFEYEDLLEAGDGDPEAPIPLLIVAALHAAVSHQFDRLQHGLDIIQAVRLLPQPSVC